MLGKTWLWGTSIGTLKFSRELWMFPATIVFQWLSQLQLLELTILSRVGSSRPRLGPFHLGFIYHHLSFIRVYCWVTTSKINISFPNLTKPKHDKQLTLRESCRPQVWGFKMIWEDSKIFFKYTLIYSMISDWHSRWSNFDQTSIKLWLNFD